MKIKFKFILFIAIGIVTIILFGLLNENNIKDSKQALSQPDIPSAESTSPSTEPYITTLDKPMIPKNVHEDLHYLWDFTFSGRYVARMTDDFSLSLAEITGQGQGTYTLFDHFDVEDHTIKVLSYESDNLAPPSQHNLYWFVSQNGGLFVDTDYYELDNQAFITYLWSNCEGIHTNKGVAVGSTESNLLIAYEDDLYYLEKDEALSATRSNLLSYIDFINKNLATLENKYDFEYAYIWQPFNPETNEIRDITFFMKQSKVVGIELNTPPELSHVYGYDRERGLALTDAMRAKAIKDLSPIEHLVIEYANALENHQWDKMVSLFEYSEDESADLLKFLKDEENELKKEGIHGINSISVLKIEPTTDSNMRLKGEQVYDVYLEMSVENPSEFYENGVSLYSFVFKTVDNVLKIDTVYYRGLTKLP